MIPLLSISPRIIWTPFHTTDVKVKGLPAEVASLQPVDVRANLFKTVEVDAFNLEEFKYKLAGFESGHSKREYQLVNKFGYMGKYQFGKSTLRGLEKRGLLKKGSSKRKVFLGSPVLQEEAMDALLALNYQRMIQWGLTDYIGTKINGFTITKEGMLAGAHLGGAGSVRKFLETGGKHNPKDKFNTSIEKYMRAFQGGER